MANPSSLAEAVQSAADEVYHQGLVVRHSEAPQSEDASAGTLRPFADNVYVMFLALEAQTPGGLHIPQQAKRGDARWARIVAVGPGHHKPSGAFVPTTVREGQYALVDKLAGQDYAWDLTVPRQNKKGCEWEADGASFRAVRESEILAVCDEEPT